MSENPRDCWETPQDFFEAINIVVKFDFDLAANADNAKCFVYTSDAFQFAPKESDYVIWCNPPYSKIKPWVDKCIELGEQGNTVVMLLPSRTDQTWFHRLASHPDWSISFVKGRVAFVPPPGVKASSNREGSLLAMCGVTAKQLCDISVNIGKLTKHSLSRGVK